MIINLKDFPVVFLSYDEPNCENNFEQLSHYVPNALRIHGVKGSDTAHKAVAGIVGNSTHVLIVDGDNLLDTNYYKKTFDITTSINDRVLSFSAINNVNGNCYGNGSVKIWPVELLKTMRTHENGHKYSIDFDINSYLELNHSISTTIVNCIPLQAWKAGFREGIKLCLHRESPLDVNSIDWRNYDRLWRWTHVGSDVENGEWCIYGARMGMYLTLVDKTFDVSIIKDHDRLNEFFSNIYEIYHNRLTEEINRIGNELRIKLNDYRIGNMLTPMESKIYKETIKPVIRSPESFIRYKYQQPYDVVFISYDEPYADKNYQDLLKICPKAKRVNGVTGIHNAHIAAAKLCETDYFFVVDADAKIIENIFDYKIDFYAPERVSVWRSKNPINDLVYGNGGVKLLPRMATIRMRTDKPDMTTSICHNYQPIMKISNINEFNVDPFTTWRSAFRECVKLSSKIIDNQIDLETEERLDIWCTVGIDKPYGKYAIDGAKLGREYGLNNRGNIEMLSKINDFTWLKELYDRFH